MNKRITGKRGKFNPMIEPNHFLLMIIEDIQALSAYYGIPIQEILRKIQEKLQ